MGYCLGIQTYCYLFLSFCPFVSDCFSSSEVYLFCDFDASKIVPAEG